jgi:hypothetical protein
VTKFFKEQSDALEPSDIEDIAAYLAPLFEFLNVNLEVLMSTLDEAIALRVIQGIWNQFIVDAEAMIVPSLSDDAKERKQWDTRRFNFFCRYISVLV